jgi:hypothetical protein
VVAWEQRLVRSVDSQHATVHRQGYKRENDQVEHQDDEEGTAPLPIKNHRGDTKRCREAGCRQRRDEQPMRELDHVHSAIEKPEIESNPRYEQSKRRKAQNLFHGIRLGFRWGHEFLDRTSRTTRHSQTGNFLNRVDMIITEHLWKLKP